MFEIVIMLMLDYSLLEGVKFNQWRGRHRVTLQQWQYMLMYAIVIIPLILMLVAEANQVNNTTKTAAYADDLTAAGAIMHLRNW